MDIETLSNPEKSFGQCLKERREELGITLEEVSEITKINIEYVEGLESCDPSVLPGEVFCRGFLRTYARYLGIESDDIIARYEAFLSGKTLEKSSSKTSQRARVHAAVDKELKKGFVIFKRNFGVEGASIQMISRIVVVVLVLVSIIWGLNYIVSKINQRVEQRVEVSPITAEQLLKETDSLQDIKADKNAAVIPNANNNQALAAVKPSVDKPQKEEIPENNQNENSNGIISTLSAENITVGDIGHESLTRIKENSSLMIHLLERVRVRATIDGSVTKNDSFPKGTRFIWNFRSQASLKVEDLSKIEIVFNGVKIPTAGAWGNNKQLSFSNSPYRP